MDVTQIIVWILGGAFCCIASGAGGFVVLLNKISDLRERIVKMEVTIELFGRKAARILHSPHNPYGVDGLIDKYLDRYYEYTPAEWREWLHRCEGIAENPKASQNERLIATQLIAICWHKLLMPPPQRRQIEQMANAVEDKMRLAEDIDPKTNVKI